MAVLKQSLASLLVLSLGLATVSRAIEPREILMLRSKAVQGNATAQYNLAKAFADPTSPNRDPAEAYVWFQIAAENGVTGDDLSKLANSLTPAEQEDAKRRLEERRTQLASIKPAAADPSVEPAPAESSQKSDELSEARAAARELALRNQQLEDVAAERGRALQAALAEVNKLKQGAAQAASPDSQLVSMTAERDLLSKQLDEAQEQLRKLKGMPERVTRAERDVELLRSQNASLTTQLKSAQQAAVGLAPSAPAAADTSKDLQERLERAEKTVAQLNKKNLELADLAQRAYSAESESGRVQERLAEAQQTIEKMTARAEAAEAKIGAQSPVSNQEEVEALKKELAETQEKLEASLRSYTLLQQEQAQREQTAVEPGASGELAGLKEKSESLERQNEALAAQLSAAEAKLAAAESDTTTQKELEETKDKLNTALRSYALLQKELDETREKQAVSEADAGTLRGQLTSAVADTQDRVKALEAIEQEVAQLRAASGAQNKEILSLQDQLRQTMAQGAALAEENAQLKTRIALLAPPPASTLATPLRPNTAAAQAAITLPPALGGETQTRSETAAGSGARSHVIAPGETLGRIARRYYGSADRWNEIYRANRNIIADPDKLPIGALLRIP